MNEVSKPFRYTYSTIFTAKMRNFLKKSIWIYFADSAIISCLLWGVNAGACLLFLGIFGVLILISLTAMTLSTFFIYQRKKLDDMVISFREPDIEILWENKNIRETKNWDWIQKVKERENVYYLDLAVWPKNTLMIDKSRLSIEEDELLHRLFKEHQKVG